MEMRIISGEMLPEEIRLDDGELKRRLGGDFASAVSKYSDTVKALSNAARVRYSIGEASLLVSGDTSTVGDVEIPSAALARHLSGCTECAVVALTLGIDADRFIRRCEAMGKTLGFVADAVSSTLADSACTEIVGAHFRGARHTSPFAVGYADTDVKYLPPLLKIADMGGTLGISFTDSHLMIPTKSIVVIVGKM